MDREKKVTWRDYPDLVGELESEPLDHIGHLMTVGEWLAGIYSKMFTDWDGYGYFSDGEVMFTNERIVPSQYMKNPIPKHFTHVMWYNR